MLYGHDKPTLLKGYKTYLKSFFFKYMINKRKKQLSINVIILHWIIFIKLHIEFPFSNNCIEFF